MAKVIKNSLSIPNDVVVTFLNGSLFFKGLLGTESLVISNLLEIYLDKTFISVNLCAKTLKISPVFFTTLALIKNMLFGVSYGHSKKLRLVGIGYKAVLKGTNLILTLGFSHSVLYSPPSDISITIDEDNVITVKGINKQKVGQVAAEIRKKRIPDAFKGKGIRYIDEIVKCKEGKKK